jgi:hypothetical protein
MKKIIILVGAVTMMLFTACNSILDTQDLTHKNTTNFPKTLGDAQQMLAGIYSNLNEQFDNTKYGNIPSKTFFFYSEVASDDRLGGGGVNDQGWQAEDMFLQYLNTDLFRQIWIVRYQGVFRANNAIETIGNVTGFTSDAQKNQMMGEVYFLRAYYYYELASLFENIPLVLSTAPVNKAQSTPDQTWGQIMSDLKTAITLMPASRTSASNAGHVDKYVAEAMMARAYLFYTGFYNKTSVALPDGSTIALSDVTKWIDDCVTTSGYSLVPDYRDLWSFTNKLTVNDYVETKGMGLKWVEDDGGVNPESMFAVKFSNFGNSNGLVSEGYSNQIALYTGLRGNQPLNLTFPFGQGWGGAPVAPNLWSDWKAAEPNDPRLAASIVDIPVELPGYVKGSWNMVQETDFYAKKTGPVSCNVSGTYYPCFETIMYGNTAMATNMQEGNEKDLVLIRFADVLLMQSELEANATGMNLVRARVGLPALSYSLTNLQNERRWELFSEGVRWNDMRRWGDTYCEAALGKQAGQPTYYNGLPDTNNTSINGGGYIQRYKDTHGFVPIPGSEITLSAGVLKQNAGWVTPPNYSGWK